MEWRGASAVSDSPKNDAITDQASLKRTLPLQSVWPRDRTVLTKFLHFLRKK